MSRNQKPDWSIGLRRSVRKRAWPDNDKEADGKIWTVGNEKNEGGVDKALCAKRKLCESETPSVRLVFPLQCLFFVLFLYSK